MLLEKDYTIESTHRTPKLLIQGSGTRQDDEITFCVIDAVTAVFTITPETIDQLLEKLTELKNDLAAGKYQGPAL